MSEASMEQLQKELEQRRKSLDNTLTAIEHRLSIQDITNNPLQYVQDSVLAEYGGSLRKAVNHNPIPATLLGIGLVWLLMGSQRASPRGSETLLKKSPEPGTHLGPGVAAVHYRAPPTGTVPEDLQEKAQLTAQQMHVRGERMTDAVPRQAHKSAEDDERALQEDPLALRFVGLALGAGIAALLPETRAEHQTMRQASDRLTNQAAATGEQLIEGAKPALQAAAAADSEAQRQTGSGAP